MNEIKQLHPFADKVVVETIEEGPEEQTISGIIIPVGAKKDDKVSRGVVVRVGPGRYENGKRIPMSVKKGDSILFSKYSFDEVVVGGKTLLILSESAIICKYD